MSILIRGMEMPEYEKIIIVYPDGYTQLLMRSDMAEVPTPHGRLIDADKMEKEVCRYCKWRDHKYENCIDCALANAPIVIEAEGE
jgi:hypothetical protein